MASSKRHWLVKSEPETYSYAQLQKDGMTNWNGVRNFQARNHLREFSPGDTVLVYHSGADKAVVGLAEVAGKPYPDPDTQKPGDWVQVDLVPLRRLSRPVALAEIRKTKALSTLPLLKQSQLSVMPVTAEHLAAILALAGSAERAR
ncbi:MAG: EVE domain-containing protein [Bdellovibrionales bacterium]|nr:EVE domain-containing protein [Bdellovibrionales bacterium]